MLRLTPLATLTFVLFLSLATIASGFEKPESVEASDEIVTKAIKKAIATPSDDGFRLIAGYCILGFSPKERSTSLLAAECLYLWPKLAVREDEKMPIGDDMLRLAAFKALIDGTDDVNQQVQIVTFAGKSIGYADAFNDDFSRVVAKRGIKETWLELMAWKLRRVQHSLINS